MLDGEWEDSVDQGGGSVSANKVGWSRHGLGGPTCQAGKGWWHGRRPDRLLVPRRYRTLTWVVIATYVRYQYSSPIWMHL